MIINSYKPIVCVESIKIHKILSGLLAVYRPTKTNTAAAQNVFSSISEWDLIHSWSTINNNQIIDETKSRQAEGGDLRDGGLRGPRCPLPPRREMRTRRRYYSSCCAAAEGPWGARWPGSERPRRGTSRRSAPSWWQSSFRSGQWVTGLRSLMYHYTYCEAHVPSPMSLDTILNPKQSKIQVQLGLEWH